MTRPNKLECLYLAITFQSSLTFAGNTRSLPRKVHQLGWLWPCPQILRPDWKGFPRTNPLSYLASSSVMKEKSFIALTPEECFDDVDESLLGAERGHVGQHAGVNFESKLGY